MPFLLGSCWDEVGSVVNESIMVRSEERARSMLEVPTQISGLPTLIENTVHNGSEVCGCKSVSELPANVGTFDGRNFRRSSGLPTYTVKQTASTFDAGTPGLGQVSVGTPEKRRDFRRSELSTVVGTFDVHR